ncbi:MAG TPA: hypothetical protein VGG39_01475 [Polyangiaceae bacterium]|jgi:hypothetical protein
MSSLHSRIADLTSKFAMDVMAAIRSASLDELTGGGGAPRRADHAGRAARVGRIGRAGRVAADAEAPASRRARIVNGRLARRSGDEIERTLALVTAALGAGSMRAEEIGKLLSLDKRELPRVLALGLKTKKLAKKGAKRGTTYSVR